jgi:transposase
VPAGACSSPFFPDLVVRDRSREAKVLGVGIDWAEEFHLVAFGRAGEGVFEVLRVEHRPPAVSALVERIAGLAADPAEVRVVIETRHGLLVEALVDAGYTVLPVDPELVSRRRGPARKKDDAADARICCRLALDRHAGLKRLIPHGQIAGELRSIARDDERACRDERRLLNRLRADLLATFPAALGIAGEDLGAPRVLRLLQRWPTAQALAAVSREEIIAFARAQRTGYLTRFADRVQAAQASEQFVAPAHLVRAKADTIRLTAAQLLLIDAQRRVWEKRMGQLLRGGSGAPAADDPGGKPFARGEIYLSFPGLGRRLAARIAGEIGEHIDQFTTANSLQVLRRLRAGHPPLRQTRLRRRAPACLQPLPGRRGAQVGLRHPAPLHLGQTVLRRPTQPEQQPPRRAESTRQPLARGAVALPHRRRALRRHHPRGQPRPGAPGRLRPSLSAPRRSSTSVNRAAAGWTEGASSWTPPTRRQDTAAARKDTKEQSATRRPTTRKSSGQDHTHLDKPGPHGCGFACRSVWGASSRSCV